MSDILEGSALEPELDSHSDSSVFSFDEVNLTKRERCTVRREEQANFRRLDPLIDMDVIQSWRSSCHASHGACCNERYSDQLSAYLTHLLLVDVETGALVSLPSTTPFVALSYVWGKVTMSKTTKFNVEQLKQPGALFGGLSDFQLPETVRDAIHVVKRLGLRHLWVDCLSIVQDETTETINTTLQAMAHIYASAELTIVAASGEDANYGLPGLTKPLEERAEARRDWRWLTVKFGYPLMSAWIRRGWTFQESLFSRRLLIFSDTVSWICGRCVWHEIFEDDITNSPQTWPSERPHLGVPMSLKSLLPDVPSLGRWGMVVQDYSRRRLTFEDDWIRAFAGATEALGATFPGGLVYGLPIFFFDIAILWQPVRKLARRPNHPSWSWVGWKGKVECWKSWGKHYAGIYRQSNRYSDWVTRVPLKAVASYQMTLSNGLQTGLAEFNGFYQYQAFRKDLSRPLPPGWERHDNEHGHFYTKQDTYRGSFRYGFPLPTAASNRLASRTTFSPILLCTAPLAAVTFGTAHEGNRWDQLIFVSVWNEHARALLVFDLQSKVQCNPTEGAKCELVALSEAEVAESEQEEVWIDRYSCKEIDSEQAIPIGVSFMRGYYNVLWIEWQGDIAYRKALGMMAKTDWDALAAEVRTIKLG